MVRGAWQGTVHGIARVRHDLAAKPPPRRIYREPKMNAVYYGELFETFLLKSGIREGCSPPQLHLTLRKPALGQNPTWGLLALTRPPTWRRPRPYGRTPGAEPASPQQTRCSVRREKVAVRHLAPTRPARPRDAHQRPSCCGALGKAFLGCLCQDHLGVGAAWRHFPPLWPGIQCWPSPSPISPSLAVLGP